MPLDDIVFPDGDPQNFIQTMSRGNGGVVSDLLTESGTSTGTLIASWTQEAGESTADAAYTWVS